MLKELYSDNNLTTTEFITLILFQLLEPKKDEVMGKWRKRYNMKLHYLYSSPTIVQVIKSRIMRWAGRVVRMGERRGMYMVLVGKSEGKSPLGRPSCK
jgi:hypothetical protein